MTGQKFTTHIASSSRRERRKATERPLRSRLVALLTPLLLLSSRSAWAVQAHGGPEGLVAHQIGHLLFIVGTGYLLYRTIAIRLDGNGWREFRSFLWLIIAWNALTFSGHWMNLYVSAAHFVKDHANTLYFRIDGLWDAFYYLTRLDHLLLLPSAFFLLLALRKWRASE